MNTEQQGNFGETDRRQATKVGQKDGKRWRPLKVCALEFSHEEEKEDSVICSTNIY